MTPYLPAHYVADENKSLTEAQLTFRLSQPISGVDFLLNNDRLITVLIVDEIIERMMK